MHHSLHKSMQDFGGRGPDVFVGHERYPVRTCGALISGSNGLLNVLYRGSPFGQIAFPEFDREAS